MTNEYELPITNLLTYFQKQHKYKLKNHFSKEDKTYFLISHQNTEKYNSIVILENKEELNFNEIYEKKLTPLLKIQSLNLKCLFIVFTSSKTMEENKKNYDILYVTVDNYLKTLKPFFNDIENFITSNNFDWNKAISDPSFYEDINNPDGVLNSNLKKINAKLQAQNLLVIWGFVGLVLLVPIILNLFIPWINNSNNNVSSDWLTGGLNRDLLIGLNQWWRLFAYPFVYSLDMWNFIILLIFSLIVYTTIKYSVIMVKEWQVVITIVLSIPLTGFLISLVDPALLISGPNLLCCSLYGFLLFYSYMNKDLGSFIARIKTVVIGIILFVIPMFSSDNILLSYGFTFWAFFIGGMFGYSFAYNYKKIDWTLIFPILTIIGAIVIPIILINSSSYLPGNNESVFSTLQIYVKNNLMEKSNAENFLKSFYGLSDYDIQNIFKW